MMVMYLIRKPTWTRSTSLRGSAKKSNGLSRREMNTSCTLKTRYSRKGLVCSRLSKIYQEKRATGILKDLFQNLWSKWFWAVQEVDCSVTVHYRTEVLSPQIAENAHSWQLLPEPPLGTVLGWSCLPHPRSCPFLGQVGIYVGSVYFLTGAS